MSANMENDALVSASDYSILVEKWSEYDPNATGWITP